MSLAIGHFAFGGILTTFVILYLLPPTKYSRAWVLLGGLWAMLPDLHWVSPIYGTPLRQFHDTEAANVFWIHRSLDVIDPHDSKLIAAVLIGLFIGSAFVADQWEYATTEQAPTKSDSLISPLRSVRMVAQLGSLTGIIVGSGFLVALPFVRSLTGLYLGIGVALILTGIMGLTMDGTQPSKRFHRMPPVVFRHAGRGMLTIGGVTGGLALLVAPLRFGRSPLTVAYAGLGGLLILLIVQLAHQWIDTDDS